MENKNIRFYVHNSNKVCDEKKSNSKLDNKEDYYYHQKARNMNTENKQLTIVRKKQNTIVRIIIGI